MRVRQRQRQRQRETEREREREREREKEKEKVFTHIFHIFPLLQQTFVDPAYNAFRETSPPQPLYTVRFAASALSPLAHSDDEVTMDVYQCWLQPATRQELESQIKTSSAEKAKSQNASSSSTSTSSLSPHGSRLDTEAAAVAKEAEPSPYEHLSMVLTQQLVQSGALTFAEIQTTLSKISKMGKNAEGPRIVARAWTDPEFKKLLLTDAAKATEVLGIRLA